MAGKDMYGAEVPDPTPEQVIEALYQSLADTESAYRSLVRAHREDVARSAEIRFELTDEIEDLRSQLIAAEKGCENLTKALMTAEAERDNLRDELMAWENGADFAHQHRRKKLRAARKAYRYLRKKLDRIRAERDKLRSAISHALYSLQLGDPGEAVGFLMDAVEVKNK
jgi:predicted RNase H-like nuclease (RuvC/YqgF family)